MFRDLVQYLYLEPYTTVNMIVGLDHGWFLGRKATSY